MGEVNPTVFENEFEYRDLSKLIAVFALSRFPRKEQNLLFFYGKILRKKLSIEPLMQKVKLVVSRLKPWSVIIINVLGIFCLVSDAKKFINFSFG